MSKFYGTVKGGATSAATRRGTLASGIRSSVQSYDGSVITYLDYEDDVLIVTIEVAESSRCKGTRVFKGTIEQMVALLKDE